MLAVILGNLLNLRAQYSSLYEILQTSSLPSRLKEAPHESRAGQLNGMTWQVFQDWLCLKCPQTVVFPDETFTPEITLLGSTMSLSDDSNVILKWEC